MNTGLIPAHAGKTCNACGSKVTSQAHPRSRGENRVAVYEVTATGGSSPLTRGKPDHAHHARNRGRLIPAHAGKTSGCREDCHNLGAHPRSRGENDKCLNGIQSGSGSSPLTRGKRCGCAAGHAAGGLIPAHAGKTHCRRRWQRASRAHPRSRGENGGQPVTTLRYVGSSPLTRGKPGWRQVPSGAWGLIPAHAGKT